MGPAAFGGILHVGFRQGSDEGLIDDHTISTATLDTGVAKFGGDGSPFSIGAMELLGPADPRGLSAFPKMVWPIAVQVS